MKDGTASHTARSVAAHRLEYERVAADYGDPAADQALTADVADGQQPNPGRMHEYLRARTAFFDRAVVNALGRGVRQVVIGGAGYDGRALRYAKPGVTWFELDHPATQADKVARVARLGLEHAQVRFVAADFTADSIAEPLLAAGLDPARPTLFLLEGVAVYLERPVVERVLAAFRQVAADGSELAMSVSTGTAAPQAPRPLPAAGGRARRARPVRSSPPTRPASCSRRPAGSRRRPASAAVRGPAPPAWRRRPVPPRPPGNRSRRLPARSPGVSPAASPASASPRPGPDRAGPPPAVGPAVAALVAFTIEADNEAEHRLPHRTTNDGRSPGRRRPGAPWLTSLLMWANCLRHLPDEGITVAELRRRARTGTNLDGMRRWGYVTLHARPGPGQAPEAGRDRPPHRRGPPRPRRLAGRDRARSSPAGGTGSAPPRSTRSAPPWPASSPASTRPCPTACRSSATACARHAGATAAPHRRTAGTGPPDTGPTHPPTRRAVRPAAVGAAVPAAARLRRRVRARPGPVPRDQRQRAPRD